MSQTVVLRKGVVIVSSGLSNKRPVDYVLVDKTDLGGKLQSNCTDCVHASGQLFPLILPDFCLIT